MGCCACQPGHCCLVSLVVCAVEVCHFQPHIGACSTRRGAPPVVHAVGELVELAQAPQGEGGPLAGAHAAGVVVELLRIGQEEVHGQEDQHEGRQKQVQQRPAPAQA